ncbi:hypothetical protein V1508DRAFT_404027 [Lipomyces doorenjongii]|uniref:uncharacterized protein n=1 Tax=Lipomyces doorenjongii TaxID=383834 RepID=UPI0034CDAB24
MSICYSEDETGARPRSPLRAAIALYVKDAEHSAREYKGQIQKGAAAALRRQISISLEMASNDDEQASYQRALNFLTAHEPERRLDIYLSYKTFQFLEENARALYADAKYPRVEYSAVDSRLHSSSAVGLQICITESIRDILIQFDKKHLASRILPVGESKYSSVDDQGEHSTKTPDAGLKYDNGQLNDLLIVGYQQLKADFELWLRKFGSRIGILLFRFPARDGCNSLSATELALFENSMCHARRSRPFGPYSFKGHTWFGTLDVALIEVFKIDAHANNISSEQYVVVQDGAATIQGESLDIGLTMGDAFPFDEQLSEDEMALPILLEAEVLLHIVESAVHSTAIQRYNDCF